MKFLLLASFVLFCSASTVFRGRNIAVNDDGTILITSQYGRRVTINREVLPTGEKNIDITISGTGIPSRTVQIGDTFYNNEIGSQGDILTQILREYQGVVDEAQYEKLLYRISQAVTRGQIDPQVYELLQNLDQQQGQVQRQQQFYGYGSQYGSGYGFKGYYPYQYQQYTPQTQYQQQYYNQIPRSYGSYPYNYYASSRYVNPLLQKIFGTYQGNYVNDLLAYQQQNGGFYGQEPQTYFSRVFGKNYVPSGQYYQQGFYGQRQTVPQVYGGQQTFSQYKEIPQTFQQKQVPQQYSVGQQEQQVAQQLEQFIEQEQAVPQQYSSVPLSLPQLVAALQTVGQVGGLNSYYYRQPYFYGGYVARQPYNVQGTYFNTVPQVQAVY